MRNIDLNAARAARAERDQDEPIVLTIGEDHYKLPREMPLSYLDAAASMAAYSISEDPEEQAKVPGLIIAAITALVGSDVYTELVSKHGLTFGDLQVIFSEVGDLYGVALGESSASPDSSTDDSTS